NDAQRSTLSILRKSPRAGEEIVIALNFTPLPHHNYRIGAPRGGFWHEILNSDAKEYGGSGQGNMGGVEAAPIYSHGRSNSITITLPPLGIVLFKSEVA